MIRVCSLVVGCLLAVSGVLFRSFWLSEWGVPSFIFLAWLLALGLGWGGKDKPYSIRFGFICASGIALVLLATVYVHRYFGIALLLALVYLGAKTKFFERQWGAAPTGRTGNQQQ
ncbi:hypothetical protein [Rhizobium sp. L9]|uniref:hypothetical protein n=1 Tax=Rhizobium sp. L9 TaxID=1340738 RepID=UPI001FE1E712|nr:hypothetical protein [Rhizobium sp. L9]